MRSGAPVRLRLVAAGLATAIALAALPGGASADVSVIPRPASVSSSRGHFLLRTDTEVYATADAQSQRIATYFTELLRTSHGITLRVRKLPQPAERAAST